MSTESTGLQDTREALKADLLTKIQEGKGDFGTLALRLFAYQYAHNLPYRRYCDNLKRSPGHTRTWQDIPTVPTDVFRYAPLFCGEPSDAKHIFRTSGTTSGKRGEHLLRSLEVYHASASASIRRLLMADGRARHALMLAPPPEVLPDSSLSSMLGLIAEEHSGEDALFAWKNGSLDMARACAWLQDKAKKDEPVQVLTTSFALVFLFEYMDEKGLRVELPEHSTLMTTGGTKGKSREISTLELEKMATERIGISSTHMVHEYGMTELGSQLYDPRLFFGAQGRPLPLEPLFLAPPWCRVTIHDPMNLHPLQTGEGLLRFTDLSNLDSVCSIQTSDLGQVISSGEEGDLIRLKGRMPGATPRGCSLMIEEAQK